MAGNKKTYQPHVKASKAKSSGTTAEFNDYKTGEPVTCLSQGEKRFWYTLRWNDNVLDIRTQYALDGEILDRIYADRFGQSSILPDYVESSKATLSTDFLVTMKDGTQRAFQIKPNIASFSKEREVQRIIVEKLYFQRLRINWYLVLTDDIDIAYADNIADAVRYYDYANVHDNVSLFQHLVATKRVKIDLHNHRLNWKTEADRYFAESNNAEEALK